jgi:hypothetical protein
MRLAPCYADVHAGTGHLLLYELLLTMGDQAIDVVPDDPQTVKAERLEGREVKVRFVGDGTA